MRLKWKYPFQKNYFSQFLHRYTGYVLNVSIIIYMEGFHKSKFNTLTCKTNAGDSVVFYQCFLICGPFYLLDATNV